MASWLDDIFSGKSDAVPFLENPFNGSTNDNDQTIRDGRQEANRGSYWVGANGRTYTNDGARGVVDRGVGFKPAMGYTQISDPNPGTTAKTLPASKTNTANTAGSAPAPKALDTAQLESIDSLIRSYDTIRDQSKGRATIKRDTSRREKEDERDREESEYEGKKLSTMQDFAGAKTDTDLNTTRTLENLVSSLSVLGLGGSRALTRQILDAANQSNRKANATQATNNQGLDSAFNEYAAGNDNDMLKIDDQFGFENGEADKNWGQSRQNALYKKGDVYGASDKTAERQAVMSEGDSLNSFISGSAFMNPSYTGETKAMATPELSEYTQDIAKYDTAAIGAGATGVTPVAAGATPGNLAVRAIAVNDKDLGVKKRAEAELGYGV